MTQGSPSANRDLLDGWKAIADYLEKSVRTAQRWKRDLGLPVHKRGGRDGENVFAYRSELDAWLREAGAPGALAGHTGGAEETHDGPAGHQAADEQPHHPSAVPARARKPSPRLARTVLAATGLVIVAAIVFGWVRTRYPGVASRGEPTNYRVRNDTLSVFAADGRHLWDHKFPYRLSDQAYQGLNDGGMVPAPRGPTAPHGRGQVLPLVQFADLDGDGRNEVLFIPRRAESTRSSLFCFGANGTVLWEYTSRYAVNFGNKYFGPLGNATGVFVGHEGSGPPRIWVTFDHVQWFPSVLAEIDRAGQTLGEYWSNGRLAAATFASIGGRDLILLGAPSNETGGGSLAVLDQAHISGSAPAVNPDYRCNNCPPGSPEQFLVFPATDVTRTTGGYAVVHSVLVTEDHQVSATLLHYTVVNESGDLLGQTIYVMDDNFRLVRAEFASPYPVVHDLLFRAGRLDHPFDERREAAQLWPVRRWNGTGWDLIEGPETR